MSQLRSTDLKRLHRGWRQRTPGRLAIALDDVQGPFNVGAILRSAAAYRAERMWLSERSTGPDNPRVGRTALGSERFMDVARVAAGTALGEVAGAAGFVSVAVELTNAARPLHEIDLRRNICLVVGNEDHGIGRATLASCDEVAYIPQLGRIGSLNVATAASIAMYEWARQQWSAEPADR